MGSVCKPWQEKLKTISKRNTNTRHHFCEASTADHKTIISVTVAVTHMRNYSGTISHNLDIQTRMIDFDKTNEQFSDFVLHLIDLLNMTENLFYGGCALVEGPPHSPVWYGGQACGIGRFSSSVVGVTTYLVRLFLGITLL